MGKSKLRPRPRPTMFTQLNLAAIKLTTNLMLKIYTPNTVSSAYIWLKLVSVVIGNICAEYCTETCQILQFLGTI